MFVIKLYCSFCAPKSLYGSRNSERISEDLENLIPEIKWKAKNKKEERSENESAERTESEECTREVLTRAFGNKNFSSGSEEFERSY